MKNQESETVAEKSASRPVGYRLQTPNRNIKRMSKSEEWPLLSSIRNPFDLRTLPESVLPDLAHEIRRYLIESVSRSGGHFAAGLGSVELTIALHYLYDTPDDRIVWDVGHQSYPHKILTGRREMMSTVRRQGGLSPFPKRSESPYDSFGVGHAGTSISAAIGMAIAARRSGSSKRAVAVIGDGGLTCGMAFEALNHAGGLGLDLLVVLNDNEMSISPNVGALANRFARLISGRLYASVKEGGKRILSKMPPIREMAHRAEEHVKGLIVPGTLFEEFGFNYIGPIDGHDLDALLPTLENIKRLQGPQLLHVITRKGKGYPPAESDPVKYHGVGSPFDPAVGIAPSPTGSPTKSPTYSQVFGHWLCDMAKRDDRLIAITPAMREGSKMERFSEQFPDRYFDVAIAEQHSVTFAAGLACEGMKPVVAIYSTFLQRAYDQVVHDVVLQGLPVLFAIDRAGVVGGDGPTHAGGYDVGFLRCLPNMLIMLPADENELRRMLYTGFLHDGPCAVRYPRGTGPGVDIDDEMVALPIGESRACRRGRRPQGRGIAFLSFGPLLADVMGVAQTLDADVFDMRFAKPLDERRIIELARESELLITVEESATGSAASAVDECLAHHGSTVRHLAIGLPDRFIEHGTRTEMLADAGLDGTGIARRVDEYLERHARHLID